MIRMRQGSVTVNPSLVRKPAPSTIAAATMRSASGAAEDAARQLFLSRLRLTVLLRPALATVVIASALILNVPGVGQEARTYWIGLLLGHYALAALFFLALPLCERSPWLVDAELVIDVTVISTLVLMTGGSQSNFVPLYFLPILTASVLRPRSGGKLVASMGAVMFGVLVASQFGLVVPQPQEWGLTIPERPLPDPRSAFYAVAMHAGAFLAVAQLTGYLAENLQRTDLKLQRASDRLADLQAYNQHVIDSMTGGLAATDAHGRILMFNRAAEAISGDTAVNVLGRSIAEVLQLPADLRRALADVTRTGRGKRTEFAFLRRSGEEIEVGLSVGPLVGSTGPLGFLFTFQDLTEFKRRERDEQRRKRLAAVGEMAAGIAHEIRNPLASMSGSMQLLRDELELNAEQRQLFDIVFRESERLNDTIRNFLAYARPPLPKVATVDIHALLTGAAQLIRNNPEWQSRHQIELQLPDHPLIAEADEAQIQQIVWNLATNGIRAMTRGGRLTIAAHLVNGADGKPGIVTLSVRDEGMGIAADDLDRIFQPFHGGFAKGSGLGLALVHRLVTDRGGEICVSSEVGKGTLVEVHWPITPQPPTSSEIEEDARLAFVTPELMVADA
jgi:two-component system sensor histidine kinase PilS (NtrC family)